MGVMPIGLIALALLGGYVAAQSRAVVWPTEAIKWTEAAANGARQAVLWGDPMKGAYGALKQVPGGTVLALHTHKNDSKVIIIKGTIALEIEGKTTTMAPGSYALLPGGTPHAATCRGTVACEYFEEMAGPFDSTPVKP
jgi:mannose-6-phosphate isomerase-like protein (cupin superfamily)